MNNDTLLGSVHLPLTELAQHGVDLVPLGQMLNGKVTIAGSVKVAVDSDFGSAIALNQSDDSDEILEKYGSDHLELSGYDFRHGVSAGVWLRMDAGGDTARKQSLFTWRTNDRTLRLCIAAKTGEIIVDDGSSFLRFDANVPMDHWTHVLFSCNAKSIVSICVNGIILTDQSMPTLPNGDPAGLMYLGGAPAGSTESGFSGRLTHFRMFGPLDAVDMPIIHSLDRVPTENYRRYAPLEVRLSDEKQEPKLYVEGGEIAHRLRLSIWNRDENGAAVTLSKLTESYAKQLEQHCKLAPFVDMIDMKANERAVALKKLKKTTREAAKLQLESNSRSRGSALQGFRAFFENHHHFELRFASGVLSKKTKKWVMDNLVRTLSRTHDPDEPLWYVSTGVGLINDAGTPDVDGNDSLYLMAAHDCDDLISQSNASAPADLTIMLAHIAVRAELDGQVIPIEVRPGPLTRRATDLACLGPSIQLLEVQSQVGQQYVPLHFSVVGSDHVINDGKVETSVMLRMTNIDRENAISIDRVGNLQTVFSLSCELAEQGGQQDWALSDQQAKVQLWVKPASLPADPAPDPDQDWNEDSLIGHSDGRTLSWAFDGHHIGTDTLVPEASVYMRISVITDQRAGPATLHLKYRHIPGYWDGSRHCTLTKSPMVVDWNTKDKVSRVGIGVAKPSSKLSVSDGVSIGATYATKHKAPVSGLNVEGSVAIGTPVPNSDAKLHVEGGRLHVSDEKGAACLELKSGDHTSFIYTDQYDGNMHLSPGDYRRHMVLQVLGGHVGIGMEPNYPLQVKGRIQGILDGSDLVEKSVPLEALAQMLQDALCPTGTILSYAGTKEPTGWEFCHGQYYSKYTAIHKGLFAVIGHSFTHQHLDRNQYFSLPDLRGMFLRGVDSNDPPHKNKPSKIKDHDRDIRNENGKYPGAKGANVGSIQADGFKAHTHTYTHTEGKAPLGNKEGETNFSVKKRTSPETGSVGGTETRPINIYVNYIIKL